jgi:hypothetical protein
MFNNKILFLYFNLFSTFSRGGRPLGGEAGSFNAVAGGASTWFPKITDRRFLVPNATISVPEKENFLKKKVKIKGKTPFWGLCYKNLTESKFTDSIVSCQIFKPLGFTSRIQQLSS